MDALLTKARALRVQEPDLFASPPDVSTKSPNSATGWSRYAAELRSGIASLQKTLSTAEIRMEQLRSIRQQSAEAIKKQKSPEMSKILDEAIEASQASEGHAAREQGTAQGEDTGHDHGRQLRKEVVRDLAEMRDAAIEVWNEFLPEFGKEVLEQAQTHIDLISRASGRTQAKAQLTALLALQGRAHKELDVVRQEAAVAEELLDRILPLEDPPADIVAKLRAVAEQKERLAPDLRDRAEALWRDLSNRQDRDYVEEVVMESLEELGYEINESFTTTQVEQQNEAIVRSREWEDFEVRVVSDAVDRKLNFVVRFVDDGSHGHLSPRQLREYAQQAALEVEQGFCRDLDQCFERVADRGVHFDIADRVEPGTKPIAIRKKVKRRVRRRRKLRRRTP